MLYLSLNTNVSKYVLFEIIFVSLTTAIISLLALLESVSSTIGEHKVLRGWLGKYLFYVNEDVATKQSMLGS